MFGIGKFFAKKKVEAKKVQNRDLMEAIIAASLLVAYADGDCSEEELTTLDRVVNAHQNLQHFGNEISRTVQRYSELMEAGVTMGRLKLMREIGDVATNPDEAEEVMCMAIDIAATDGNIDEDEVAMLKMIGQKLGLNPGEFL